MYNVSSLRKHKYGCLKTFYSEDMGLEAWVIEAFFMSDGHLHFLNNGAFPVKIY